VLGTPGLISLTNNVPFTNTVISSGIQDYNYDTDGATNVVQLTFELSSTADFDLYAQPGSNVTFFATAPYTSTTNVGAGNEVIMITTNSAPITLSNSMRWFAAVSNAAASAASYVIKATEVRQNRITLVNYATGPVTNAN